MSAGAVTRSAPAAVPGGLTGYTVTSSPGGRTCAVDVVTGSEPRTCIVYGLEGASATRSPSERSGAVDLIADVAGYFSTP